MALGPRHSDRHEKLRTSSHEKCPVKSPLIEHTQDIQVYNWAVWISGGRHIQFGVGGLELRFTA